MLLQGLDGEMFGAPAPAGQQLGQRSGEQLLSVCLAASQLLSGLLLLHGTGGPVPVVEHKEPA